MGHRAAQKHLNSLWRAFRSCGHPASSRRSLTTYSWQRRAKKTHRTCRFRQARVGKLMKHWCHLSATRLRAKRFACRGLKAVKRNPAVQAKKMQSCWRHKVWLVVERYHPSLLKEAKAVLLLQGAMCPCDTELQCCLAAVQDLQEELQELSPQVLLQTDRP